MKSHEPKYTSFIRYIVFWIVYVCLTIKFPSVFTGKMYLFIGLGYLIVVHNLYAKQICTYLLAFYPDECRQAMQIRYPQERDIGENRMTLLAFAQGYRHDVFDHSNDILFRIYVNYIIKDIFSYFMFFTLSLSFGFNYFLHE